MKNLLFTGIPTPVENKDGNEKAISALAAYVKENLDGFGIVFVLRLLCDFSYIIFDALLVYFMDSLTDGFMFTWDFLDVFNKDVIDRKDPLTLLFPHIAKCHMAQYAVDGSQTNLYAMCSLVQNVMMEKFFIIGWMVFLVFGIMTVINVAYFLLLSLPCCRYATLNLTSKSQKELLKKKFDGLSTLQKFGLWYAISFIKSKVDNVSYKKFIQQFVSKQTAVKTD